MDVDEALLDRTAAGCYRVHQTLDQLLGMATRAGATGIAQQLQSAREQAWNMVRALVAAGAVDPAGRLTALTTALTQSVPLHLLDSPATRRLLEALRAAEHAAAAVDTERGWLRDGEPCGYTDAVAALARPVALDVHGPPDLRQHEGRE